MGAGTAVHAGGIGGAMGNHLAHMVRLDETYVQQWGLESAFLLTTFSTSTRLCVVSMCTNSEHVKCLV